jgi:aminoglycoside/choline kinase family phosphotransferase
MLTGVEARFDSASLTMMLSEAGLLKGASIESVRRRLINLQSTSALLVRMLLTFNDEQQSEMPKSLVLKTASSQEDAAAFAMEGGHYRKEVRFYQEIAPVCTVRLPRCYASSIADDSTARFHLLLEDCLPANVQHSSPLGLPHAALRAAVDWLVDFHAQWITAPNHIEGFRVEAPVWEALDEQSVRHFVNVAGDYLTPNERCLLDEVLIALPLLNSMNKGPVTLRHGDYHPLNLFFNRQSGTPMAIDWQFCEVGSATMDLVDLLCLHCHPQDRRELAESLVYQYWRGLCQADVSGYSWSACWRDFRIDAARAVLKPVFLCTIPSLPSWAAISRFKQAVVAFDDLACREVLPSTEGRTRG